MWFMATQEGRDNLPDTWQAMSDANHIFKGMREYLRQGDITGAAQSDPDTIVDMIRADGVLVVPVITAKAEVEMTDENCAFWSLGLLEEEPHWILAERATDVTITVPDDFAVNDLFEVVAPSPENQSGIREITTPIPPWPPDHPGRCAPSNTEPTHVRVSRRLRHPQAITDAMAEDFRFKTDCYAARSGAGLCPVTARWPEGRQGYAGRQSVARSVGTVTPYQGRPG